MRNKKGFWLGALVGALLTLFVGGYLVITFLGTTQVVDTETAIKIQAIRQMINSNFLYGEDIDEEQMQEGIIKGYLAGLGDPYSVYYNEEEMTALMESLTGEIFGIGVIISQDIKTGILTFNTVYKDSPAEKAGFKEGDILYCVEGKDIAGEDLDTVVSKIRGEKGTTVELTVLRGEAEEEYTAKVTRDIIQIQTVSYEMKADSIGYIYISGFDEVTYGQFEKAIQDLKALGMKGLVIDVRSNPGGQLNTVCDMLDLLLPEGVIVSTKEKDGKEEVIRSDVEQLIQLPMCVLVDGNSASASEVFAGAIQDYGIGKIVGTKTYGKGIVQQIFSMPDGSGVKLTISEYFTPNGRSIHGKGIEPDVEVEFEYDETNPEYDNQLEKALEVLK